MAHEKAVNVLKTPILMIMLIVEIQGQRSRPTGGVFKDIDMAKWSVTFPEYAIA